MHSEDDFKVPLLALAIEESVGAGSGLAAIYLPVDVPEEIAVGIAFQANARRGNTDGTPYAIIVDRGTVRTPLRQLSARARVLAVNVAEAIRYRQGDRLVVVAADSADLESFSGVFRTELGQEFPSNSGNMMERIANAATRALRRELAGSGEHSGSAALALANALDMLARQLAESEDARGDWTARWYEMARDGLEAIRSQVREIGHTGTWSGTFEDFILSIAYAAFGLPSPDGDDRIRFVQSGAGIARAFRGLWSSSDAATSSQDLINACRAIDSESVRIEWDGLDSYLVAGGSPIQAVQRCILSQRDSGSALNQFGTISENEFVGPAPDREQLSVTVAGGVDGFVAAPQGLVGKVIVLSRQVRRRFGRTEPLAVRVPFGSGHEGEALHSQLKLDVSSGAQFVESKRELDRGALEISGAIEFEEKGRSQKPFRLRISARVLSNDPLFASAGGSQVEIVVFPAIASPFIVFFQYLAPSRLGQVPRFLCVDDADRAEAEEARYEADSGQKSVLAFVVSNEVPPKAIGASLFEVAGRAGLYVASVDAGQVLEVDIGGTYLVLQPTEVSSQTVSPLRAAATRSAIFKEALPDSVLSDVRSRLETFYSEADPVSMVRANVGHVFAPEARYAHGLGSDCEVRMAESGLTFGAVPIQLRDLVGWKQPGLARIEGCVLAKFFEAFEAVARLIWKDAEERTWVSRTSLRHLWEDDKSVLDAYLLAYTDLVECAQRLSGRTDRLAAFVASLPFSMSIWRDTRCVGVLISPLHPLRLAWLAAAESVLRSAVSAESLMGTIEGWRFPYMIGGAVEGSTLIAVPFDSGYQEVFSGWSLMVPVRSGDTESLRIPRSVAGMALPGVSTGGLTSSAVSAALKDYVRVNPQVSSLCIDLASSEEEERISEVDQAVVAMLREVTNQGSDFLGITVEDSINRRGEIPRSALNDIYSHRRGSRLTWRRYDPLRAEDLPPAMVRIQQDSVLRIGVASDDQEKDAGVVGDIPLRRFGAELPDVAEHSLAMHPLVSRPDGGSPFQRALAAAESGAEHRELRVEPRIGTPEERSRLAEWTVSGEAIVAPAAIQDVLRQFDGGQRQMLWEWRPPLFDPPSDTDELERRGYVTMTRVPESLRRRIDEKVSSIANGAKAKLDAAEVLDLLGARGVGLASLLTVGDKQASGAIGFYLAMRLCGLLQAPGRVRMVLPIDSCQAFLDVLSGARPRMTRHRADLLLLDLSCDRLVFEPIEVKMYGLGTSRRDLPSERDSVVKEAVDQVRTSRDQVRTLLGRRDALDGRGDWSLWNNALAALVDTGMKLLPTGFHPGFDVRDAFRKVVEGSISLFAGKGLAMVFVETSDHDAHWRESIVDDLPVLIASPEAALEAGGPFDVGDGIVATLTRILSELGATRPDAISVCEPAENTAQVDVTDGGLRVEHGLKAGEAGNSPEVVENRSWGAKGELQNQRAQRLSLLDESSVGDGGASGPRHDSVSDETIEIQRVGVRPPGVRFPVGDFEDWIGKERPELWLGNTELNQLNIGVVGDLGTGKTQLVKYLIASLRSASAEVQDEPLDILVFDYKRDYCDSEFLSAVGGEVLSPHKIPLNFFALPEGSKNLERVRKIGTFFDVLEKIYGGLGPRQRLNLSDVILCRYEEDYPNPPTLERILADYRDKYSPDSVASILYRMVSMEMFADGKDDARSFPELIKGKVLVLNLNELGTDQDAKNVLVVMFLNLYFDYMNGLKKWGYVGSSPSIRRLSSYVVVDEATNIMRYNFQVLSDLMLQGREFGVGVMLSTQYLSHFRERGMNWAQPLRTWFILKVPHTTQKELQSVGVDVSRDDAERVNNLSVHEALFRGLDADSRFIMTTPFYSVSSAMGKWSIDSSGK